MISKIRRIVFAGLATLGLLLLAVTFTPVVRLAASAMAQDWHDGTGEVLVVLGASMLVPGTGANATLGEDTYLRCVYASWVFQTGHFHRVIVSGGDGLAETMADFLIRRGVPADSIWRENAALSTYQNALYTKRILERHYGRSRLPQVVVLTSDYHSWRARRTFEHCGLETAMIPIPDVIKRSSSLSFRWTGTLLLLSEVAKDLFYLATGKM